nr:MAG TPA: SOS-response transcriptional repressor [Caudoviricetes sp.]
MKIQKAINISSKVQYNRTLYGLTMEELAVACRVGKSTLYYHLQNPDKLTLGELKGLSKKLHMPIYELIGEQGN